VGAPFRIGEGWDTHALVPGRPLIIGGVTIPHSGGLLGHSDADVLIHARTGVGDPQAGQTENLDTVTAVVLGGTSLFGGRGVIIGSLLGALIVGVFRNGLTLMGVSSVYQILITGVLVILAVATDQWSRRPA
jgi:ribose/xylose/arabinose/galactoside ABC-type transport system permease subunit